MIDVVRHECGCGEDARGMQEEALVQGAALPLYHDASICSLFRGSSAPAGGSPATRVVSTAS